MIGKKIKQRRLELGLSQEELAKKMGYKSRSTINKIELDKHDINQSKLVRLAKALDCSPSYFITDSDIVIDVLPDREEANRVLHYANKLNALTPEQRSNVMQYIDFISRGDSQ